jgi:hypothetical protein
MERVPGRAQAVKGPNGAAARSRPQSLPQSRRAFAVPAAGAPFPVADSMFSIGCGAIFQSTPIAVLSLVIDALNGLVKAQKRLSSREIKTITLYL